MGTNRESRNLSNLCITAFACPSVAYIISSIFNNVFITKSLSNDLCLPYDICPIYFYYYLLLLYIFYLDIKILNYNKKNKIEIEK